MAKHNVKPTAYGETESVERIQGADPSGNPFSSLKYIGAAVVIGQAIDIARGNDFFATSPEVATPAEPE